MTKTLMAIVATTALGTAMPAFAQTATSNMSGRVTQLQTQLQTDIRAGRITRAEAQPLREQLRLLRQTERQYSLNGLTVAERQDLQVRIRDLRAQIRYASRNDLTRYGSNQQWVDVNRDGWDDRDTNRDGILDVNANAYANANAYPNANGYPSANAYPNPQCVQRTGVAGILSNVFGGGANCGLQVGQRATGQLYAVPPQLQYQYRDGNGVYYRYDGRQIYQIDARTQTVLRVFNG